jgi:hypothetical protein
MTKETKTEKVEITVQDLAVIRSVIDAATKGGIFSAKDLSTIGQLHDKVNFIVEDFVEKNKETPESE